MFCVSVRLIFSKFGNAEFGKLNSYCIRVHSLSLSVADADGSTIYNDDVRFYSRPSLEPPNEIEALQTRQGQETTKTKDT